MALSSAQEEPPAYPCPGVSMPREVKKQVQGDQVQCICCDMADGLLVLHNLVTEFGSNVCSAQYEAQFGFRDHFN